MEYEINYEETIGNARFGTIQFAVTRQPRAGRPSNSQKEAKAKAELEYLGDVKLQLVRVYGFTEDPENPGTPLEVPNGTYPMKIGDRIDKVHVSEGKVYCGNFLKQPTLSLLILRSINIEKSLEFFGMLGMSFNKERQEDGREHHTASLGHCLLTICPTSHDFSPTDDGSIGLVVDDLDAVITLLRNIGVVVNVLSPSHNDWGYGAVAISPDGLRVGLSQARK